MSLPTLVPSTLFTVPVAIVRSPSRTITARGIYGLGNAVTESANTPETLVNNQGVTARIQFAGKKGVKGSWRVNRIDWVPTANVHQGNYQWCPISSDHPIGTCWDEAYDAQIRQRIWDVIYSMGADQNVVKEWNITQEQAAKQ